MRAILMGVTGPVCGRTIPLEAGQITIGRAASNGVCVPDRSVSREHCVIRVGDGRYEIEDLGSYNGTFVNGLRVRARELNDGDAIIAGEIEFVFRAAPAALARAAIAAGAAETSQSVTVCAPDVPLARETAALQRVSELVRVFQALYLERDGESRGRLQGRLFEIIYELIPSRCGLLATASGDRFEPFASDPPGGPDVPVPEGILDDAVRLRTVVKGRTGTSDWMAAPLTVSNRATGVLYVDSGGKPRDYLQGDAEMISALSEVLALALENARDIESLRFENDQLRSGAGATAPMIGNSAPMRLLFDAIARVSRTNATVLIRGESGTGKELVARAIHRNGSRSARPFVVVNCAAIAENLLESEMFGHEKGAFTGAYAQRKGKFEQADSGTLFLDEVGELALPLQAKLLRVLQEHEFERVGGSRTLRVDVRVIAATNRELEQAIKAGAFREDLYYRLNVVPLRLPPLRERREDIPLLANWFVRKFAGESGRAVSGISREARALLVAYDWPGNVRELQNVIERAVVMGSSDVITPDDVSDLLPDTGSEPEGGEGFHEAVRQMRRGLIAAALDRANGSVPAAARALRLHPNYLHRLITTLGLRDSADE
jgi:transcriptional regulator with GAF, ATPase, and Fis domain